MPEITKPTPGNFCWVELATSDPAAGKKFYTQLLGWNTTDMPMPDQKEAYTMADIGGKHVAGIMRLPEPAKAMGAPPHWLSYVAVADCKAHADKATSLGGKVVFGPVTMGPGMMAVVQDPAGGTFALWQTLQSMGTFLYGEDNALCWNELMTTNVDAAGKFYSGLFGWKFEPVQMSPEMTYIIIKNGEQMIGGMMAQPKEMAGAPSMWGLYFAVADCDGTVAKATSMGAQVFVPPTDIPNTGRFATLADPQGAAFSVLKPIPMPAK